MSVLLGNPSVEVGAQASSLQRVWTSITKNSQQVGLNALFIVTYTTGSLRRHAVLTWLICHTKRSLQSSLKMASQRTSEPVLLLGSLLVALLDTSQLWLPCRLV